MLVGMLFFTNALFGREGSKRYCRELKQLLNTTASIRKLQFLKPLALQSSLALKKYSGFLEATGKIRKFHNSRGVPQTHTEVTGIHLHGPQIPHL